MKFSHAASVVSATFDGANLIVHVGLVLKARALGVTWARIGETLGMTRQSAWERFSGEE